MGQELKNLLVETFTKGSIKTENLMDTDSITGTTEVIIKAVLKTASAAAMEYGKETKVLAINMKASSSIIKNKDMEYIPGNAGIYTKAIIIKICVMVMARFSGKMEVSIEDFGKMTSKKGKGNFLLEKKS